MSAFARLIQLDRPALLHGLNLALAAWLSFSIAVLLSVDNPFWAAMPVWVLSQAYRGLVYERALWRILGTLVGAGLGLAFLHLPNPYLQLLGMALVVGVASALTHVFRGALSYLPMLAGITIGVVVLPSVLTPDASLDLALSRVECTLIGVLVTTLLCSRTTPRSQRKHYYERVRVLAADALGLAAQALGPSYDQPDLALFRRIRQEIVDLDSQARLLAAGSWDAYRRLPYVDAFLYAVIELLAASEVIVRQRERGLAPAADYERAVLEQAQRLQDGQPLRVLRKVAVRQEGQISLARLRRAMGQIQRAEEGLFAARAPARRGRHRFLTIPAISVDWPLATRTGLISGLAAFSAGGIAYALASPALELMAIGVCTFSIILGSMPRPQLMSRTMFTGIAVGVLVASFYRYVIQGDLVTDWQVIASVLPFLVIGGLLRANRPTSAWALDANMCFQLASQAGMAAVSWPIIMKQSLPLLAGSAVVCSAFFLLPRRTHPRGQALVRRVVREIYPLIRRSRPRLFRVWRGRVARQWVRLLHWMGEQTPQGLLSLINLGHGVVALKRLVKRGSEQQACVRLVCELLEGFEHQPQELAQQLQRISQSCADTVLAQAILDVAQSLQGAQAVLVYAYPPNAMPRAVETS
ncbi:MAG: FUSC family protein [Alcaligenes sp.]